MFDVVQTKVLNRVSEQGLPNGIGFAGRSIAVFEETFKIYDLRVFAEGAVS